MIAGTLAEFTPPMEGDSAFARPGAGSAMPATLPLTLRKIKDLRYGENPHQPAAWYAMGAEGLGAPAVLQGKELSFTNLLDLDSAARIAAEFTEPAAVVIKHTNPCGAATGLTIDRSSPTTTLGMHPSRGEHPRDGCAGDPVR